MSKICKQIYFSVWTISVFTFTGSLAYRLNNKPIENFGVTPDIMYHISEKDLQYSYPDYKNEINQAVNKVLE